MPKEHVYRPEHLGEVFGERLFTAGTVRLLTGEQLRFQRVLHVAEDHVVLAPNETSRQVYVVPFHAIAAVTGVATRR